MQIHQVGGIGFDSNIYLIIDEVVTLIDAGTGMNFETVTQNMGRFNLKPSDIELIINTHCHYDHAGGDKDFVRAAGCGVAIHEREAELLKKGDQIVTLARSFFTRRLEPVDIARELRDGDQIKLGELILRVIHTPGHTRGSACFYEPNRKILFSGDTVFCGGVGRTDLPTSDVEALANSLRKLAKLDIDRLYPGHGPLEEKNAGRYILDAIELIG